ncbi:MAG TPA: CHAP domain-containing protein [Candidatus Saccharimonadaceae bacterium]|nr:CHAP domain-containing protein [Candidatus Saccharimonadaceae bacterium]
MRQRSTTPVSKRAIATRSTLVAAAVLMAFAMPATMAAQAHADSIAQLQARVDALKSQQNDLRNQAQSLSNQANTLAGKISDLQNQQASMQNQINLSQAQYDELTQQITKTEQEIAANKQTLGSILSNMYVDGHVSTLEMLASSKNIGDFVDKQAYQSTISDKLTSTIKTINDLKASLQKQQQGVKLALANEQNAKAQLAASQAEQQQLLNETQGQESAYQGLIKSNQSQQDQLSAQIAAQMAATIRSGSASVISVGGSGGGYPYNCQVDAYAVSPWTDKGGYGCSQCVSYAAWMMGQVYGQYPVGWGNADNFPGNAQAAGMTVSYTPHVNSIVYFPPGVNGAGSVGHVAWVEGVSGNTITVSQYNYYTSAGWGKFSRMTFTNYGGMEYIYP